MDQITLLAGLRASNDTSATSKPDEGRTRPTDVRLKRTNWLTGQIRFMISLAISVGNTVNLPKRLEKRHGEEDADDDDVALSFEAPSCEPDVIAS